jgi:DNA modification methylase
VTPYYDDGSCVIYHGDCRDVLPVLGSFDLVLTDPPYGIGEGQKKARGRYRSNAAWKGARDTRQYDDVDWDDAPVGMDLLRMALARGRSQIVWGGNYYDLPPAQCWLVWDKETSGDFADCELAWTKTHSAPLERL